MMSVVQTAEIFYFFILIFVGLKKQMGKTGPAVDSCLPGNSVRA